MLIALYLQSQLAYDRYNEKADRMVRVVFNARMQGHDIKEANVMPPVAQTFKKDFPEVEAATRIRAVGKPRVSYHDKLFREDELAFVDSNFFNVFTLPLIRGNSSTALLQPNTVVITKQLARKFFGNDDPIGKVLALKDNYQQSDTKGNGDSFFGIFLNSMPGFLLIRVSQKIRITVVSSIPILFLLKEEPVWKTVPIQKFKPLGIIIR